MEQVHIIGIHTTACNLLKPVECREGEDSFSLRLSDGFLAFRRSFLVFKSTIMASKRASLSDCDLLSPAAKCKGVAPFSSCSFTLAPRSTGVFARKYLECSLSFHPSST